MSATPPPLLKTRVILQDLVETLDNYGQAIQTWVDLLTLWAEVKPLIRQRGGEIINVRQVHATATHYVTCRFMGSTARPRPEQRFKTVQDGRILNILSVNNVDEANHLYLIVCSEYVV